MEKKTMKLTLRNRAIAGIAFAALSMIIQRALPAGAAPPPIDGGVSPGQVIQKPDLFVPTLSHYKAGTSYYMWATVKNKGTGVSVPCQLRMKIHLYNPGLYGAGPNAVSYQYRNIPALAPGEEYTATGYMIGPYFEVEGTQLRFKVDSENVVQNEWNEYNNHNLYEF
jgi:hypothetical protein